MSKFNAAWENPEYVTSQSDHIVKHEVEDAKERLRDSHEQPGYQAARLQVWQQEARRRGLST